MRHRKPFIVGVGDALRVGSTSERAFALALGAAAERGAAAGIFSGPAIALPAHDRAEQSPRLVAARSGRQIRETSRRRP